MADHENTDEWLPLSIARKYVPCSRPGNKTHKNTLVRWIAKGLLEGKKVGGCWFVRRSAIQEFLSGAESRRVASDQPSSAAEDELAQGGW